MRRLVSTPIALLSLLGVLAVASPATAAPTAAVPAVVADAADAAATELFISEYIEGSSFNKAIEIYNGTGAAVDLAP